MPPPNPPRATSSFSQSSSARRSWTLHWSETRDTLEPSQWPWTGALQPLSLLPRTTPQDGNYWLLWRSCRSVRLILLLSRLGDSATDLPITSGELLGTLHCPSPDRPWERLLDLDIRPTTCSTASYRPVGIPVSPSDSSQFQVCRVSNSILWRSPLKVWPYASSLYALAGKYASRICPPKSCPIGLI